MRVLQIAGAFPPARCGVGDYVARLADGLAHCGDIRVAVLTQRAADRAGPHQVEVLGEARSWRLRELPGLVRRIREWKPDLVHIHWPSQGFGWRIAPALLPAICRRLGSRVVQTWHEPWFVKDIGRLLLQRATTDGLVFVRPNFVSLMPRVLLPLMPGCPQRIIGSAGALPVSPMSGKERIPFRERYLNGRQRLVVFFGFLYPEKGVEQLFDIADPESDALVIAGAVLDGAYRERLEVLSRARGWGEQVQYTGYLQQEEAADLLCAADAVVLPFVSGGGDWNTSMLGALAQGTLVITTSAQPCGDDPARNLYTAPLAGVDEMRHALRTLGGRRIAAPAGDGWMEVARSHAAFYRQLLNH